MAGQGLVQWHQAGFELLCMFADDPVPGLQPGGICGSCFPGALAPGCVVSGFQPDDLHGFFA